MARFCEECGTRIGFFSRSYAHDEMRAKAGITAMIRGDGHLLA